MSSKKKKAPGQVEVMAMCANARRVASLCDLLGFEFRGAHPMIAFLERAYELGHHHLEEEEDGSWILPEDFPDQGDI